MSHLITRDCCITQALFCYCFCGMFSVVNLLYCQ